MIKKRYRKDELQLLAKQFVMKRIEGFEIEEEWEMDNNSIELTVTRWIS